jgi:small subunit ribosomal protein S5
MTDEDKTPQTSPNTETDTVVSSEKNKEPEKTEEKENPKTNNRKENNSKKTEDGKGGKQEKRPRRGNRNRTSREPKEFEEAILQIDRVTRVVAGGRRLRFRVSVVIGDGKGRVGFGIGKASEVMLGVGKAAAQAKRNCIKVPIFDGTIPHEITSTFKSSQVLLFPAPEGKGVIAGGAVRKILELAGVKDVLSKVHGSRNKINVARATIDALTKLYTRAPHRKRIKDKEREDVSQKEETLAKKEEISSKKKVSPKKQTKKLPSKTSSKKTEK